MPAGQALAGKADGGARSAQPLRQGMRIDWAIDHE